MSCCAIVIYRKLICDFHYSVSYADMLNHINYLSLISFYFCLIIYMNIYYFLMNILGKVGDTHNRDSGEDIISTVVLSLTLCCAVFK